MGLPIYQVDAFAERAFTGNPAMVCLLDEQRDGAWMQHLAREMNLSETAFINETSKGYHLRWFTPTTEVPLCGHATLASAHILWETGRLDREAQAQFHTQSGILSARLHDDRRIEMNFPSYAFEACECPAPLLDALRVRPKNAGRAGPDYLLELDSEETLITLHPDFESLAGVEMRGVIVTSRSASESYDFVSRFFAPAVGIEEDPVTGSAHCALGPYWGERLNKREMIGYQASRRGGVVRVRLEGEDRIALGGRAVTILKGELLDG